MAEPVFVQSQRKMLERVLLPLIHQNDQDDKVFLKIFHKDVFTKLEKYVRGGFIAFDNGHHIGTK